MRLLHPKGWAPTSGFANGVAAEGRQIFVAGQVGWNVRKEMVDDDFVAQVEQALRNIVDILAEADARPEHLVRLTWYITDKREYIGDRGSGRAIGASSPALPARRWCR